MTITHGTHGGFYQHKRQNVPVCDDCREARRDYLRVYREINRETLAAKKRAYYRANQEKLRERRRINAYGITKAEYDQMVMAQCGACGICGELAANPERQPLGVDHDHDSGAIRGLLCSNCNIGIGNLRDSPELLYRAIDYLEPAR